MNSLLTLFSFTGNVGNCGDYDVYINFLMFFAMCKNTFLLPVIYKTNQKRCASIYRLVFHCHAQNHPLGYFSLSDDSY